MLQFHGIIAACKATPTWAAIVDQKGWVSMYDVCKFFVCPWTMGSGSSLALLLNSDRPLAAELMISHAWGEDVDECAESLMLYCESNDIPEDVACWFCVFANYQPGDGPTISEQIAMDPFGSVISAIQKLDPDPRRGMVVVHTSTAELYSRLWCVFEIGKALYEGVSATTACSFAYIVSLSGKTKSDLGVHTESARCSSPEDEEMIRQVLVNDFGGYEGLDSTVLDFRMAMMARMNYELRADGWHARKNARFYRQGKNAAAQLLQVQAEALDRLRLSQPAVPRRGCGMAGRGDQMAEDTEKMPMSQVFNYVLEGFQDPKFTADVQTLISSNIDLFARAAADGSHLIEWELQHRKYKKLHEEQLQRSVSLCNASFEDFMEYVAARNHQCGDDPGFQSLMAALTNSEDYNVFCQAMFDAVRENWVPEDPTPPPALNI